MQRVVEQALAAGYAHGVTRAGVCSLEQLSRLIPCSGARRLPERGSVVTLLLPYYSGEFPRRNIAAYAIPDDYHRIAGVILEDIAGSLRACFPQNSFIPFVDSSPIPEVEAACRCGLGFRGRNGQLITREYGSMTFIGEIVTDRTGVYPENDPSPTGCGGCHRCVEACPTGALTLHGLEPARCRSAITQKKGVLSDWERSQVAAGGLVWGCDICTAACPYNAHPTPTPIAALRDNLTCVVTAGELDTLLKVKSFGWRGKAVLTRNLEIVTTREE